MIDKHEMWTHRRAGGVYQVLGAGVYKGDETLKDMATVQVNRYSDPKLQGWGDLDIVPKHWTVPLGQLIDTATVQVGEGKYIKNGDQLVVYRGADAKLWVRPVKEFFDGRFQKLDDNLQPVLDVVVVKKTSAIGKTEALVKSYACEHGIVGPCSVCTPLEVK